MMIRNPQTGALRPARRDDARALAVLIDIAGDGIPAWLWSTMAGDGETPLEVGERRAGRDSGGFSWRHATVAEEDGTVVGMLLCYRLPETTPAAIAEAAAMPPLFRELTELELAAPGSLYVNALAVRPDRRGRGIGAMLLAAAEAQAVATGAAGTSIQCFASNLGALALYRRAGYVERDQRPIAPHPAYPRQDRMLLLVKPPVAAGRAA